MALDMQILWITKADCFNPHRYITSLGGMNADGSRWTLTESAAIVGIDAGRWNFYVSAGGRTVAVIVDVSARGHRRASARQSSGPSRMPLRHLITWSGRDG
jgi:hypothetical protein